jgi:translation initiation factor IF-3
MDNVKDELADVAKVEQEPKFEGRTMHMILVPVGQKSK